MSILEEIKNVSGGDIWATSGGFVFDSPLKDLLATGEYTLEQLLREDELLQELKGLHPQLIEFMSRKETVQGLVRYLVTDSNYIRKHKCRRRLTEKKNGVMTPGRLYGSNVVVDEGENESISEMNISSRSLYSVDLQEEGNSELPQQKAIEKAIEEEKEEIVVNDMDSISSEDKQVISIRYPYMACEVICCEISGIIDTLVDSHIEGDYSLPIAKGSIHEDGDCDSCASNDGSHENFDETDDNSGNSSSVKPHAQLNVREGTSLLDLLFSLLDQEPGTIDDRHGGYFEKVLMVLFRLRPSTLGSYLSSRGLSLLKKFINHINNYSIMQLLLRLVAPPISPPTTKQLTPNEIEDDTNNIPGSFGWQGNNEDGCGDEPEDEVFGNNGDCISQSLNCEWYNSPHTVQFLMSKLVNFSSSDSRDMNEEEEELKENSWIASSCAAEILISLIQSSPKHSQLLISLTCSGTVLNQLIERATTIFDSESFESFNSPLTYAMNVLEFILLQLGGGHTTKQKREENSDDDESREMLVTNVTTEKEIIQEANPDAIALILSSHILPFLYKLLNHPNTSTWTRSTQTCEDIPILGASRLCIVKLISSMVLLSNATFDEELAKSDILSNCLDLFFQFEWCNMLHQCVTEIIVEVIEGGDDRTVLQNYFIYKCNLLERLVNTFEEIDNKNRPGYMGHVIVLCQTIENVHSLVKNSFKKEEAPLLPEDIPSPFPSLMKKNNRISTQLVTIIEDLPYFDTWCSFVSTTLVAAVSIKSNPPGAPLMGLPSSNEQLAVNNTVSSIEMLEMNESDLDIAANMISSLDSLGDSTKNNYYNNRPAIIASEDDDDNDEDETHSAVNFGTAIDIVSTVIIGHRHGDYYYDDPLGNSGKPEFNMDDHQEEVQEGQVEEEIHEEVPVIDLFAGNFHVESSPSNKRKEDSSSKTMDDIQGAFDNFADFESANFEITNISNTANNVPEELFHVASDDEDNVCLFDADFSCFQQEEQCISSHKTIKGTKNNVLIPENNPFVENGHAIIDELFSIP